MRTMWWVPIVLMACTEGSKGDTDTGVDTDIPTPTPTDTPVATPTATPVETPTPTPGDSDTDPADTDTGDTDPADTDTDSIVDTDTGETDDTDTIVDTDTGETDDTDTIVDTDTGETDDTDTIVDTDTGETDDTDTIVIDTDTGETDDTDPIDTDDTIVDTDTVDTLPIDTDTGDTDTGPGHSDSGPGHSDSGPRHSDTGPRHSDTGPRHSDTGPRHSDTGPRHSDTGPRHSDTGPGHSDSGPRHSDSGFAGHTGVSWIDNEIELQCPAPVGDPYPANILGEVSGGSDSGLFGWTSFDSGLGGAGSPGDGTGASVLSTQGELTSAANQLGISVDPVDFSTHYAVVIWYRQSSSCGVSFDDVDVWVDPATGAVDVVMSVIDESHQCRIVCDALGEAFVIVEVPITDDIDVCVEVSGGCNDSGGWHTGNHSDSGMFGPPHSDSSGHTGG